MPIVPWTVYRYVLGDLLRVTLLAIFAVSLLYTMLAAYQTVRSGLGLGFIWPLLARTLAYPLYFSLPVSFLFAVTLVLGRMAGDLEITALRTQGFSYRQIYAPVIALGVALSGVSFYLNGWLVPNVHYARRNLQTYILDQVQSLGAGYNRTILLPGNEGSLWVNSYSGQEINGVRVELRADRDSAVIPAIRDHLPRQTTGTIRVIANRGRIEVLPDKRTLLLSLRAVQILVPEPVRSSRTPNDVFHQTVSITDSVVIPLSFAERPPGNKDRTNPELLAHISALGARPAVLEEGGEAGLAYASYQDPQRRAENARRAAIASTELHRRMAFTLSSITFAVLGVALVLYLDRWGRLVPFFASNLVVIVVYYPLLVLGVFLGEQGIVPAVSMALPNAALLGLGIYLTRKVVLR